jgi:hypothetical protein
MQQDQSATERNRDHIFWQGTQDNNLKDGELVEFWIKKYITKYLDKNHQYYYQKLG